MENQRGLAGVTSRDQHDKRKTAASVKALENPKRAGMSASLVQHEPSAGILPPGLPPTREESGLVDLSMQLDESQLESLSRLGSYRYASLIGAAGTGKTTLVKRVIAGLIYGGDGIEPIPIRNMGGNHLSEGIGRLNIACVAFTGKATQNMKNMLPKWLHPSCRTIHSLLEFAPESPDSKIFKPRRNAENPLNEDLLVIDEASMVGINLWHLIMDAAPSHMRIILIGDLNQLVPVADQPMFPHALAAGLTHEHGWGLAALTKVHRQKGDGANKIVGIAHAILQGRRPTFDMEVNHEGKLIDSKGKVNPDLQVVKDWHTLNIQVPDNPQLAQGYIIAWLKNLSDRFIPENPTRRLLDPYLDFVLTPGNGANEEGYASPIQQIALNHRMSEIFNPDGAKSEPYLIDAGREERLYRLGDRVMATKNEAPGTKGQVTNGTLGVITKIVENGRWQGDRARFGKRSDVLAHRQAQMALFEGESIDDEAAKFTLDLVNIGNIGDVKVSTERQASHIIDIEYETGETRTYATAAEMCNTQLAYALTTHKSQGSQADTVVVIAHSAAKAQLNREWLYTAATRASRRLIFISTEYGLRIAVGRQQLSGATLEAKVQRYKSLSTKAGQLVRLSPDLPLRER